MRGKISTICLAVLITGCSTYQVMPPPGYTNAFVPINDTQASPDSRLTYKPIREQKTPVYRQEVQDDAVTRSAPTVTQRTPAVFQSAEAKLPTQGISRITIAQAIKQYVPAEYKVQPAADVELDSLIRYDNSHPWIEALGKSLGDAGVEMSANLYKKAISLKALQIALSDILDQYVPADYKVFPDADINLETLVRYDNSRYWIEALAKSMSNAGIEMNANLDKKLILLKPIVTTNVPKDLNGGARTRTAQAHE